MCGACAPMATLFSASLQPCQLDHPYVHVSKKRLRRTMCQRVQRRTRRKPTSPAPAPPAPSTVSTIKEEKQSAEIFSTASASTPNVPLPRVALSDEDTNKEVSLKAEADTDLKADIVTKPPNVDLPDTVTTSGSDTPAVVKIEEESSMDVVETAPSETSQVGDVKDSMPSDVKDPSKECVSAASNEVPGGNLERVKRLSSSGLSASDEATPSMPSLPENQPVEMRFAPGKGTIPQPFTVINEESAFEQKSAFLAEAYDDDGPEDLSYEEYFTFSGRGRRYMVLQLVNSAQKKVKMGANQCTVVNTITGEGSIGPETLGSWPLDEPWTDGLFYFIFPNFPEVGEVYDYLHYRATGRI